MPAVPLSRRTNRLEIPTPYFVAGGTLAGRIRSYVERQADTDLYQALLAGEYCYVLDTRQVGKSSLIVRSARRLREAGRRTAILDLSTFGDAAEEEQWYFQLVSDLARVLGMEEEAEAFWDARLRVSCAQRWFLTVRDLILPRLEGPLVVFVDELEAVRKLSFSTDGLFAMIRALSNLRAEEPSAERLTFCLVGVATPADLIRDPRTTPFNVGRRIELRDFAPGEMASLAQGLHGTQRQREEQVRRIGFWTGGHPYLTQRFCQAAAGTGRPLNRPELDALCHRLFLCRRAQSEEVNLHFVRRQVLDDPQATDLLLHYDRLRSGERMEAGTGGGLTDRLLLSGLARIDADPDFPRLRVRNRIYARVFGRRWVRASLPGVEARRQKQALRLGFLRASLLWCGLAAALLFALARQWQVNRQQGSISHLETKLKAASGDLERKSREVERAAGRLAGLDARIAGKDGEVRRLDAAAHRLAAENEKERGLLAQARGAQRDALRSAAAVREDSETRREAALALMGSVTSGQEFDALEHGLRAVAPALGRHAPPPGEAIQALSAAVSAGIYRLFLLPHRFRLETAEFSPDGRRIVTAGSSPDIYVWDAQAGRLLRRVRVLPDALKSPRVWTAEYSADGRYLVTAGCDRTARLWDAASLLTPAPRCVWTVPCGEGGDPPVLARFSKTGRYLAVSGASERGCAATVYEVGARRKVAVLPHSGAIESMDFNGPYSEEERRIALAGKDSPTVTVYDFLSSTVAHTYTRSSGDPARRVRFDYWDDAFYSAGNRGVVTRWEAGAPDGSDTRGEDHSKDYLGHQGPVSCLATSRDGCLVASAGFNDGLVQIWSGIVFSHPLYTLRSHAAQVTSVRFSGDCTRVVTASYDGTAEVWLLDCHAYSAGKPLNYVALSPDGKRIAAPSEGHVEVWHAEWDPRHDGEFRAWTKYWVGNGGSDPVRGKVYHAAYSPDGTQIATAAGQGDVRVWDVTQEGRPVTRYVRMRGHSQGQKVNCVAFSPDGRMLLSASDDGTARLWDARTGQALDAFESPDRVVSCAFSPDGKQVLAGCADGGTRLYSLDRRQPARLMQPPGERGWASQHYPWSVAFSPDGKQVLTGDADGNAYLWDRASGKRLASLAYGQAQVFCAQYSADGTRVLAVGGGGYAKIWNVHQALAEARLGRGCVPALSIRPSTDMLFGGQFSPDGQYIFVAGEDCLVRKYPVTVGALVREARRIRALGTSLLPESR